MTQQYSLHMGDCLDVLPTIPRNVAIVSDPPYGIAYVHRGGGGCLAESTVFGGIAVIGDDKPFDPTHLLGFKTVLLFGANNYASKLPDSTGWIVWDKRDGMTSNNQSDCELIWTNRNVAARLFSHRWSGMIKDSEKNERRVHPTQKPVTLMVWLIRLLDLPRDTIIVDPYMGAGATGVAAVSLGYRFIGIEISEQYYAIAERRIRDAAAQPMLPGLTTERPTHEQDVMW